ncbi:hypothetical protein [Algibacter sp. PT7-4]|uniref:hypothetical protein n=1 Tax=Algibacter ulvanivorans TaxID=3400999 RepID=UPI003AAE9CA0
MKKLKATFFIFCAVICCKITAQNNKLRFPEKENLIVKLHTHYHFQETNANYQGLNYVFEAGYTGKLYTLIGFERFNALKGASINNVQLKGYTSFNAAIGLNHTHGIWEQWQYNAGVRIVRAYRGPLKENRYRHFIGWEAALTYQFKNGMGIGIRGTIDNRRDQDIFNWPVTNVASTFFTITYKLLKLK